MKLGNDRRHLTDLLFTLALLCVFAATAMVVVLIGANVYKKTVSQMDQNFTERTSLSYVTTKIRQNDVAGSIRLDSLEGVPALVLDTQVDGEDYQTWIYHHDGALREVYTAKDAPMDLLSGQPILEVAGFHFEIEGESLLLTSVSREGRRASQWVAPRCGLQDKMDNG